MSVAGKGESKDNGGNPIANGVSWFCVLLVSAISKTAFLTSKEYGLISLFILFEELLSARCIVFMLSIGNNMSSVLKSCSIVILV